MTYLEDIRRFQEVRIEALQSKVEELEAKIEILERQLNTQNK